MADQEPPLPENLAALIGSIDNPTPDSATLASIVARLTDAAEEIQKVAVDVATHGVPVGRLAIGMIGDYALAWGKVADVVRGAAVQGALIDARQLLDVMQSLHDRFELQGRAPNDSPEDLTKETTDG